MSLAPARDAGEPGGDKPGAGGELGRRVISAVVLGVVAIATALVGGLPFLLVWTAAALWIWWEWTGIVGAAPRHLILAIGAVAISGMAVALALQAPAIAILCAVIGAGVVMATVQSARAWASAGMLYAAAVLLPVVLLRDDAALGLLAVLWLFAVVWAADIAAYFSGRLIGGPRLAVRVSPSKTWAGALGGLLAGVLAGLVLLYAAGIAWHIMHLAILLVVVIAAELGDLIESAVKRRFGFKDASRLVPGHGGLMDRLDGFLVAATVAVAIGIARQGADAPAVGLFVW